MIVQFKLKSYHWITITSFRPSSIECLEWNMLECLQKTLVPCRTPQKKLGSDPGSSMIGLWDRYSFKILQFFGRAHSALSVAFSKAFSPEGILNNTSVVSHSSYANTLKLGFAHFTHSLREFHLHSSICNVCDFPCLETGATRDRKIMWIEFTTVQIAG